MSFEPISPAELQVEIASLHSELRLYYFWLKESTQREKVLQAQVELLQSTIANLRKTLSLKGP